MEMGASTAYKADGSWTCCLQAPSSAERPGISTEKQHGNISSQHACVLWPNADVSPPHHVPPYVMDRPAAIQLPPQRRAFALALNLMWLLGTILANKVSLSSIVWTDLACACSHPDRSDEHNSFSLANAGWTTNNKPPFVLWWTETVPWYACRGGVSPACAMVVV